MSEFRRASARRRCPPRLPFRALLFGWTLAIMTAAAALAQGEGARVDAVRIDGLAGYRPEQILPRLQTQPGQVYDPVEMREDIEELGKIFRTVNVQTETTPGGGLDVVFTVSEFPRFRELQVVGNQKLKTERIERLVGMERGSLLDAATLDRIRRALRNEYKALGMPQARVTLNLIDQPAEQTGDGAPIPQADLQIVLDEGRQVLVDDVLIEGNDAFSDFRLKGMLQTKGSVLIVKNYYDEETFAEDLDRLRDFYAAHGYFDAVVQRGMFVERTGGKIPVVSPVIQVNEGVRYTFGDARVRGARLFSHAEVAAPFEPLKGELFDARRFAKALDELSALYYNHGLLTTEITPEYQYDTENQVLNMVIDVDEKSRIYVGRVRVERPPLAEDEEPSWFRGWYDRMAPPVKNSVILREVLLEPGEVYNKRLERETVRRLSRWGIFENVNARNEATAEPGVHDLVLSLRESTTGSISGGVGFGDAAGAFVYAAFNERNVGGRADVFGFNGRLGTRESELSITYLDRHFKETRDSMAYRLFYESMGRPGYRANVAGFHTEWAHPLEASDWTMYVRGRLEGVDLNEREHDDDLEDELDRSYAVLTGRLKFIEDTREPVGERPREGYIQAAGAEIGYAGGPLVKLEAERDQYRPVRERMTWRLAMMAGLMPFSADLVPIHERYFLGGNTDMRGFAYRGAGYFDGDDDDIPVGGGAKILVKNELHYPIVDPISGLLFVDVGTLGDSPVSWQVPRVSLGTGLRFDMRNVQVGLDLAAPIVSHGDDETRFFHFSLQSAF
ncbi:MAG: Outer membrane protein assembly factor BamA precursor [candidate division BRC1 bacterium ADurb.BinA292]|nr:MAG: Outer membrane protein assembly factor BamA precursor [candidate division BRC1 bacterium ADurb.BinA292]